MYIDMSLVHIANVLSNMLANMFAQPIALLPRGCQHHVRNMGANMFAIMYVRKHVTLYTLYQLYQLYIYT